MIIYHIADRDGLEKSKESGFYTHPTLESDGFIHASTQEQVIDTANRRFVNENELLVLKIDTTKLNAEIKFEEASTGEKYPHIYGPVSMGAVLSNFKLSKDMKGKFIDKNQGML